MCIKDFYNTIKTDGLKSFSSEEKTKEELKLISKYLSHGIEILDVACGYGRLTIPLAKQKYNIKGVDISHELIKGAKAFSKQENIKVEFKKGDMRSLPYSNCSFDLILWFWTSFSHLLNQKDQLKFLNEQYRVLKNNGTLLIDVVDGENKAIKSKLYQHGKGKGRRILKNKYQGCIHSEFIHDKASIASIFKKSKFVCFKTKFWNRVGRRRLLGILKKIN